MSLNDIQLPATVVQGLYRKLLVEEKNKVPVEKSTTAPTFSILGKNKKGVLVIVKNEATAFLPDEELNLLLGILAACKLNMDDVGILNIYKYPTANYQTISQQLGIEKALLFGINAEDIQLPLSFPQYQIQRYNNQVYLCAPTLSALQNNKAEKTKLWNSLQQIFSK